MHPKTCNGFKDKATIDPLCKDTYICLGGQTVAKKISESSQQIQFLWCGN